MIHLEIVYKFYLYDNTIGTSEIDHWIGPNRNDSLREKLEKLKSKRFTSFEEINETLDQHDIKITKRTLSPRKLMLPQNMQNACAPLRRPIRQALSGRQKA